jgi:hypothetical protein
MLTYRGDKFVKGKKFRINEQDYRFSKYDSDNFLIFEAEDKKSLRISKEEFDEMSKYDLVQADSDKLDEFYNDSSLTFEGCTTDKDNIDYLYNWLKELGCIKEGNGPLAIYTYKGSLMNDKYQLTGGNKYPADLNMITVMLKDINFNGKLPLARMELGGRWFDDIVDNNSRREGMTESSIPRYSRVLLEKINQDNKEINDIIGKALRSKTVARKYEDKLKDLGIKLDYDQGQGVTMTGPSGKTLSAGVNTIYGPTRPGHNGTHYKTDSYAKRYTAEYEEDVKEHEAELAKLKAMKRDDIIRQYPKMDTKTALKTHKGKISDMEDRVKTYTNLRNQYANKYQDERIEDRRWRSAGHKLGQYREDKETDRTSKMDKIDFLNYLTKKETDKPLRHSYWRQDWVAGDSHQEYDREEDTHYAEYRGKNGVPGQRSETLKKYDELKQNIADEERYVSFYTPDDDDDPTGSYAVLTDKQLEKKIQKMRANLEKEIEELIKNNDENKANKDETLKDLRAAEKELDDFLKSKKVREAVVSIINGKRLNESGLVDSGDGDADYIETRLSAIYDDILLLAQEASHSGFQQTSTKLQRLLDMLEDIPVR